MYTQMILWVPTTLALLLTSVVEKQLHSLVGRWGGVVWTLDMTAQAHLRYMSSLLELLMAAILNIVSDSDSDCSRCTVNLSVTTYTVLWTSMHCNWKLHTASRSDASKLRLDVSGRMRKKSDVTYTQRKCILCGQVFTVPMNWSHLVQINLKKSYCIFGGY